MVAWFCKYCFSIMNIDISIGDTPEIYNLSIVGTSLNDNFHELRKLLD